MKKNILNQFVYGMGSFFNIFNKEHKKCVRYVIENNIKIHSSIYYPGSPFFLRNFISKKEKKNLKLIIKISGYNFDQFRYELDYSIKEFDSDNFFGIQFWDEIPHDEDKNINFHELKKIIKFVDGLKKKSFLSKIFLQIRPNQINLNESNILNYFDGFAFYAYPNEAQLDKENYSQILKNNKIFLQMQFFGGRYKNNLRKNFLQKEKNLERENNWVKKCINYSFNNFGENLMFVGSTKKINRLKFLVDNLKNYEFEKHELSKFSDECKIIDKRDYSLENHKKNLKKLTSKFYLLKQYFVRLIKFIF